MPTQTMFTVLLTFLQLKQQTGLGEATILFLSRFDKAGMREQFSSLPLGKKWMKEREPFYICDDGNMENNFGYCFRISWKRERSSTFAMDCQCALHRP